MRFAITIDVPDDQVAKSCPYRGTVVDRTREQVADAYHELHQPLEGWQH